MGGPAVESDAALVSHARNGDRAAFGSLVERYRNVVCAIAYSRLGDAESAQDVAQEAFLVSLEGLPTLRSGSKFAPWLRTITRRLCNRWHRSEAYRRALREKLREQRPALETKGPVEVLEAKEDGAMLRNAIARLPKGLSEALVLYYFEGLSQAEAARSLGISQAAVEKRLTRAKRRVREYLTSELEVKLRNAAPGKDFTARALAAVPIGSICGKLGLNVARVTAIEALQQIAHVGVEKASTIITGGGTIMTTKQAVAGSIAALLLAASVGTNVALLLRGKAGPEQAEALAVAVDDLAIATAEAEKALAEKDELTEKLTDLEKEVERQKKRADAAWQSRQALANELATLEGTLDEELARLQGPEGQDDREPGEQEPGMTRSWIITRSTALTRLNKISDALGRYRKERETFPASLTELAGLYLEDESAIIDPSTGNVFEYESGWNAAGNEYYKIESAEGSKVSGTMSPDGSSVGTIVSGSSPGEGSANSPSPGNTPSPARTRAR